MTNARLAYFVSRFPHLYQTFVRREIDELVRQGAHIHVFPIAGPRRGGRQDRTHARSEASVDITTASLCAPATWRAAFREFGRHAGPGLRLCAHLLRATRAHPVALAKSLVAFLKGLAWSDTVRHREYTHIHAHWSTYPGTAAMVASALTGIPFSFAFHAYDIFATRILIPEKIARAAFVVVNCRYTRDYILRTYPETDPAKLILVYNSLDLPKYARLARQPDPDRPLILAIGQLVPTKGFADLLEACALLAGEGRDFRLVFAGAGPLRTRLAEQATQAALAERVEFAGEQTEAQVRELLSRATMLVMPCVTPGRGTHDALPNVVIEALAAGVPVVATNVFGIPEIVQHEKTGLLVPERSSGALKAAMARLLDDPALAARLAAAGKRRAAELFDGQTNGRKLLELFQRQTRNTGPALCADEKRFGTDD